MQNEKSGQNLAIFTEFVNSYEIARPQSSKFIESMSGSYEEILGSSLKDLMLLYIFKSLDWIKWIGSTHQKRNWKLTF